MRNIKYWLALIGIVAIIVAGAALVNIALKSPLVIVAVQVAALALVGGLVLLAACGVGFALYWLYHKAQRVGITTATERAKSVVVHQSGNGTVFGVNPLNLDIQPLHFLLPKITLEDVRDQLALDQWSIFHQPKRVPKVIEQIAGPEPLDMLPAPTIPEIVRIEDAIDAEAVSINHLFLGMSAGNQPIYGKLKDLSHIAIGGTSRWGKSTLEQALLYQLVIAREDIDFYLSDVGGTAFLSFGIPYADSPELSERLVARVYQIFEDRKNSFKRAGLQSRTGIRSLDVYNRITGESLPVVVLAVDEATALMADNKQMAVQIRDLILQAGKYGIFLMLSGQNWTAKNVGTTTRDQFSSRFQLKAMDRHQASILISNSGAEAFSTKGRASVLLPGAVSPVQIQTPLIDEETIVTAVERRSRTVTDFEWIVADEPADDSGYDEAGDKAETIRRLYKDGMSKTDIANYFGYKTNSGAIFYEIKDALEGLEDDE